MLIFLCTNVTITTRFCITLHEQGYKIICEKMLTNKTHFINTDHWTRVTQYLLFLRTKIYCYRVKWKNLFFKKRFVDKNKCYIQNYWTTRTWLINILNAQSHWIFLTENWSLLKVGRFLQVKVSFIECWRVTLNHLFLSH